MVEHDSQHMEGMCGGVDAMSQSANRQPVQTSSIRRNRSIKLCGCGFLGASDDSHVSQKVYANTAQADQLASTRFSWECLCHHHGSGRCHQDRWGGDKDGMVEPEHCSANPLPQLRHVTSKRLAPQQPGSAVIRSRLLPDASAKTQLSGCTG